MNKVVFPSFDHAMPKFLVRPVYRSSLAKMFPRQKRKLLFWPADSHSVTRSPHTSSSLPVPARRVAKRMTGGSNLQSAQSER